jgi:hypothetical protein
MNCALYGSLLLPSVLVLVPHNYLLHRDISGVMKEELQQL